MSFCALKGFDEEKSGSSQDSCPNKELRLQNFKLTFGSEVIFTYTHLIPLNRGTGHIPQNVSKNSMLKDL